ncbi:unnamed protein product [Lepeophtheirus salmonis]|uniref:(salmon louse) hypothetical protein n=1 Tax=Lepeophtheirus salmonis TaxID=72036 RepID=A0A7R8CMQ8_LEPSM|nr:unnamed protein product [Lepeophtheirus salmonis]CAF2823698.1 unnamed protein product [Lepeophtheirus salmonis]
MAKNPESSLTYSSILQPKNKCHKIQPYSWKKRVPPHCPHLLPLHQRFQLRNLLLPPLRPHHPASLHPKTPTTASTSIPSSTSKTPTSRSAFRFKSKKSRISSPFLEKFLAKHRRRKGLLENVKTESTTTFKPSTSSDSDISKKSTTTTVNTTTIAPTTTTTAIPSDIVR